MAHQAPCREGALTHLIRRSRVVCVASEAALTLSLDDLAAGDCCWNSRVDRSAPESFWLPHAVTAGGCEYEKQQNQWQTAHGGGTSLQR